MKNIFFVLILSVLFISGCSENKPEFVGSIFINEDDGGSQLVGFDQDRIIFKWDDTLGVELFETGYELQWVNDSTVVITLEEANPYMETNIWEIIVTDRYSFYSKDSGKKYSVKKND